MVWRLWRSCYTEYQVKLEKVQYVKQQQGCDRKDRTEKELTEWKKLPVLFYARPQAKDILLYVFCSRENKIRLCKINKKCRFYKKICR